MVRIFWSLRRLGRVRRGDLDVDGRLRARGDAVQRLRGDHDTVEKALVDQGFKNA